MCIMFAWMLLSANASHMPGVHAVPRQLLPLSQGQHHHLVKLVDCIACTVIPCNPDLGVMPSKYVSFMWIEGFAALAQVTLHTFCAK